MAKVRNSVDCGIEIFECNACGSDPGQLEPSGRRPGDSLEGQVVISAPTELKIDTMEVLLQGVESANVPVYAWEYDKLDKTTTYQPLSNMTMVKCRDMFVDIKHGLPLASVKHETDGGLKKYSVPFSFIVPSFFEYPPSTNPLLCSALPPSFDTAAPGPTPWHQVPPPRLAIAYRLHARVQYRDGGGTEPCPIEETKPIHIIANPPAQAEQFPEEFAAARRATLSKHALGGRLGSIDVCASEPPPLIQLSSTLLASTQSTLSVTFNAASMSQSRLQKISLHVRPSIRQKTFYSPNALQCPPKEADLAGKNLVRLHENVMPLSEQRFSNMGWRLRSQGMEMCAPPTYEDSESTMQEIRSIASSGPGGLSPSDRSSVTPRVSLDGSWTASLELSIQPPALLVPAFCGRHIARSYSLVLRIRVSGAHGKIPDLELPLQVVYPPPPPPPSGQTSMLEQVSGLCQDADGLLAQEQTLPSY